MPAAKPASDQRRVIALLLLAGLLLRLIWLDRAMGSIDGAYSSSEASRVALAVASGRGIADAYYDGYGPTAHLMPVSPGIAGFVMWLFGPRTAAASLTLLGWCLLQVGLAYFLLRALFRRLGADERVLTWGMALLCLVAPFVPQETIDFRYWEGAMALCLAAANLLLIVKLDAAPKQPRGAEMLLIAGLFAVTLFVCAPVGLATGLCWTIVALRRLDWRHRIRLGLLTAAAIALVVTPWALRNERALGHPVLLRSNFGIEFALANHAEALSDRAPEFVYADRIARIHPFEVPPAIPHRVPPGGEVAYSHALAQQTWAWVAANPGGFARLCARHVGEFLFPRPWQMYFTHWEGMRRARAATISIVNLLGLIGLALGLYRRRRGYGMIAAYVAAISIPYALFEPTARYIYLVYGLFAFLAVEAVMTVGQRAAGRLRRLSRSAFRAQPAN